jgi:hypothetical protein
MGWGEVDPSGFRRQFNHHLPRNHFLNKSVFDSNGQVLFGQEMLLEVG